MKCFRGIECLKLRVMSIYFNMKQSNVKKQCQIFYFLAASDFYCFIFL
jgi:hypothetical protein